MFDASAQHTVIECVELWIIVVAVAWVEAKGILNIGVVEEEPGKHIPEGEKDTAASWNMLVHPRSSIDIVSHHLIGQTTDVATLTN